MGVGICREPDCEMAFDTEGIEEGRPGRSGRSGIGPAHPRSRHPRLQAVVRVRYDTDVLIIRPAPANSFMAASPVTSSAPISRSEWSWLVGALLLGAVVRLSLPGRIGIEHFDEGVYASNFWFGAEAGHAYPARHLYAPPLLPAVVEWTLVAASLVGLPLEGLVPVLPVVLAGLATIPSLWWVGRTWFGPVAGLTAAWLIAASDLHATYSRACLTDAPLSLFLVWAVYFAGQALQTGRPRDMALSVLFSGLAWWTKYNGWLPLVITLAGTLGGRFLGGGPPRMLIPQLQRWSLITLGTAVVWSPVWAGLQRHGGYAAVAANHGQYVVGLNGWWNSACRQMGHVGFYESWLGNWPGLALTSAVLLGLALVGVGVRIFDRSSPENGPAWYLLAWLIGLSLAIPAYQSYPRLTLPWLVAIYLALGSLGESVVRSVNFRARASGLCRAAPLLGAALILSSVSLRIWLDAWHAWEDRTGWARAVREVASRASDASRGRGFAEGEQVFYVNGEPAAVYGLNVVGMAVGPVQSLEFARQGGRYPTYLVWCDRGDRSRVVRDDTIRKSLVKVAQFELRQSSLVLLDDHDGLLRFQAGRDSVPLHLERLP